MRPSFLVLPVVAITVTWLFAAGCIRCGEGQVPDETGTCVTQCNRNDECAANQVCQSGACRTGERAAGASSGNGPGSTSGGTASSSASATSHSASSATSASAGSGTTSSAGGTSASSSSGTLSGVTPTATWSDSGDTVTVAGTGFTSLSQVRVGTSTLPTTFLGATELQAPLPRDFPPGIYDVEVSTHPGMALRQSVQVLAKPAVLSVTPSSRWNDEPHVVALQGENFRTTPLAITAVRLGQQDILASVVSSTELGLLVPAGVTAGTHDLVVERQQGLPVTCGACFTVTEPVVLTGPQSGLLTHDGKKVVARDVVTIAPHNGSDTGCGVGATGCLAIHAAVIVVEDSAVIDGDGRGYGGGGGGGGGHGMGGMGCGTAALGGAGAGGGGNGADAPRASTCENGGSGGGGGEGGGPAAGTGGVGGLGAPHLNDMNECDASQPATPGTPGMEGGYAQVGTNGDTSADEAVQPGSGGGGGGGGGGSQHFCGNHNYSGGSGGGGGAGGRGGAAITLRATERIDLLGAVKARGARSGGNGGKGPEYNQVCRYDFRTGGAGGNANAAGTGAPGAPTRSARGGTSECELGDAGLHARSGGGGGAGAGGGVLLHAPGVALGGTVDASGGATVNGGTVKVFTRSTVSSSAISAGRVMFVSLPP